MVRGFFEGFFYGLADCREGMENPHKDVRLMKQLITDQYDNVSKVFAHVMIPLMIRLNYSDLDAVTSDMQKRHFSDSTPVKMLLRYSCGSKILFDAVTEEYRRQITALLMGHVQTVGEHFDGQSFDTSLEPVGTDDAIRAVVRSIMHAYALGIKAGSNGENKMKQHSVLLMMIDGMHTLLNSTEITDWEEAMKYGLDGVYRKVCHTVDNYGTVVNEMNRAYEDLALAEGVSEK